MNGLPNDFDKRFDSHFDKMYKMMDKPVKTVLRLGAGVVVINLLILAAIIAMVIFGLSFII